MKNLRTFSLLFALTLALSSSAVAESRFYLGLGAGGASLDIPHQELSSLRPDAARDHDGRLEIEETADLRRILFGYRPHANLAVEVAWQDFDEVTATQTWVDVTTGDRSTVHNSSDETQGFSLFVRGILPPGKGKITKRFELFAKAGILFWDTEATASNLVDNVFGGLGPFAVPAPGATGIREQASASGTSFGLGLGLVFNLSTRIGLRIEWERFLDVGEESASSHPVPEESVLRGPLRVGFEEDLDTLGLNLIVRF